MKLLIKIVGALGIVAISFVATLWLLDRNPGTCPPGRIIALNGPFGKFAPAGVAYAKDLTGIDILGDADNAPTRSRILLCEDNSLIGTAHSLHGDIVKEGRGRFSHWGTSLVFSTSDNTDPNTNGRSYVAVLPR